MYRRITHSFWMILGMIVALAIGAQAQSRTPNLLDWQAIGGSGAVQSAIPFTLKNVTDNETLRYGSRTWGIDLVWDKSETLNNIKFEKQTGSGDVKYNELYISILLLHPPLPGAGAISLWRIRSAMR